MAEFIFRDIVTMTGTTFVQVQRAPESGAVEVEMVFYNADTATRTLTMEIRKGVKSTRLMSLPMNTLETFTYPIAVQMAPEFTGIFIRSDATATSAEPTIFQQTRRVGDGVDS